MSLLTTLLAPLLAPITTSGSGIIEATPTTFLLTGDNATDDSFIIQKQDFGTGFCKHPIFITNFQGANENTPGDGLGLQDYLVLENFTSKATFNLDYQGPVDSKGGAFLFYDIHDAGQTYELAIYSKDGGSLVFNYDWYSI